MSWRRPTWLSISRRLRLSVCLSVCFSPLQPVSLLTASYARGALSTRQVLVGSTRNDVKTTTTPNNAILPVTSAVSDSEAGEWTRGKDTSRAFVWGTGDNSYLCVPTFFTIKNNTKQVHVIHFGYFSYYCRPNSNTLILNRRLKAHYAKVSWTLIWQFWLSPNAKPISVARTCGRMLQWLSYFWGSVLKGRRRTFFYILEPHITWISPITIHHISIRPQTAYTLLSATWTLHPSFWL